MKTHYQTKGMWENINITISKLCPLFIISTSDIQLIQIREMTTTFEIDFVPIFPSFCGVCLLNINQYKYDAKLGYYITKKHCIYILCGYQITCSHLLWLLSKSSACFFTYKTILWKVARQLRHSRKSRVGNLKWVFRLFQNKSRMHYPHLT